MEALLHVTSHYGNGFPNIYTVNLDVFANDYSDAGETVIKEIQLYGVDNIEKVELRHGGITVNISNGKVPFLASVQLGDLLCSLDRI